MAAKIRIHELAKELGLTNKETLDLCGILGIGVKTHSSGIEEAQADRLRRKAEREGLVRDEQPEEPKKVVTKKAAATKATKTTTKKAATEKTTANNSSENETDSSSLETSVVKEESDITPIAAVETEKVSTTLAETPADNAVSSKPETTKQVESPVETESSQSQPLVEVEKKQEESAEVPAENPTASKRVVTSSGGDRARPAATRPAAKPADVPAPRQAPEGRTIGATATPSPGVDPGVMPKSRTGKPIPPPPRAPMSLSGKPIPPPPGQRRPGPGEGQQPSQGRGGPGGSNTGGGRPPMQGRGPGRGGPGGGPGQSNRPAGAGGGRGQTNSPSLPNLSVGAPSGGPGGPPSGGPGGGRGRGNGPGGGNNNGPGGRRPQQRRKGGGRRRRNLEELQPMDAPSYTPMDAAVPDGVIVVERASTAQELGPKFNRTAADVIRFLMQQGEMVTATQSLNDDMIELFAAEIGAEIRLVNPGEEQEVELQKLLFLEDLLQPDTDETWEHRPPVITVMGHVDHGKTKLLDRLRNANVVAGEAGGITQHIGAYQVIKEGRPITFIDTPGHEAFTAMRARGATATDIVILVVAADDGVMPQTIEAINHAKAAEVPIVVAINKIDRENADPTRVMQQLSEYGLVPEPWGGDTIMVEISALQQLGLEDLLENLLVVSEVEDLRATPSGRAVGVVLESHLDIGRGPVATVLVQQGTLRVGEPLVAGAAWGRIRALINDRGEQIKEAGPSTPVQVLGLSEPAMAGDQFVVAPDEKTASKVAQTREHWIRLATLGREAHAMSGGAKLEDIFQQIQAGETATLALILKADVTGSLEALTESLRKLERDDVKISFVHRGVGGITENDIQLAAASNATIIGFNVRPDRKARDVADKEGVEVRNYEIIYKVLEDMENAMLGLLEPEYEEIVTGEAEVREIFRVPKIGAIAGCYVQSGVITRGSKVRFLRDGTIIWKGTITSLRRFKDDAKEVATGFECGIGLSDFQDLKPGDIIETCEEREIPRS